MKLPAVEYEAPATVAEVVGLLAEHQDEASVLAGGQSLIPLLALRLARPAVLVDINGLGELSGVSVTGGQVTIGAMTREYVAEESPAIAAAVPLLAADAESLLVGEQPSAALFEEAARQATAGIDPPADLHGSSEYRKKVAATLVRRALQAATDSAQQNSAQQDSAHGRQ